MPTNKVLLKYTGGGYGGAINGVPARDLTDADVAQFNLDVADLVKGGLYEYAERQATEPVDPFAEASKASVPEYDDKATKRGGRSGKGKG